MFLDKDFLKAILDSNPGKIKDEHIEYVDMALKRIPGILRKFN